MFIFALFWPKRLSFFFGLAQESLDCELCGVHIRSEFVLSSSICTATEPCCEPIHFVIIVSGSNIY